jgi:predicted GNAT family acetyltransferase
MNEQRWKRLGGRQRPMAEALLRRRESWYVGAASRYLESRPDHIWALQNKSGDVSALIVHSHRTILPCFDGANPPLPKFMNRFLRSSPIHAIQGLAAETAILEDAMAALGREVAERINYDLMTLDREPAAECFTGGPANLILRRPDFIDLDKLYTLQAAYEQEEVLPLGSSFNAAACRYNLQRILEDEQILAAEIDGDLVGKINTSAKSFSRCMIGGIYVHPAYRGRGIARRMIAEFLRSITASGTGVTLFVKKHNAAARAVYRHIGFSTLAEYRITYY